MLTTDLLMELNGIPTHYEYQKALDIIKKFEGKDDMLSKLLYIQLPEKYYAVGKFAGWSPNGDFILKNLDYNKGSHITGSHYTVSPIEYVFVEKQETMIKLNTSKITDNG